MSTGSNDVPPSPQSRQAAAEDISPTDRKAWLSKVETALEEAKELLILLDDGPSTDELIERISRLKEFVRQQSGASSDALGQDHPIWTELAPWTTKSDED